jgi:hypothetical protein
VFIYILISGDGSASPVILAIPTLRPRLTLIARVGLDGCIAEPISLRLIEAESLYFHCDLVSVEQQRPRLAWISRRQTVDNISLAVARILQFKILLLTCSDPFDSILAFRNNCWF